MKNIETDKVLGKKSRYFTLKKLLSKYSRQYYLLDDPAVTDAEYDKLYNELLAIEKEFPEWVEAKSPSQKVGTAASKKFKKITHSSEMLSLDNAYNEEDITAFFERVRKLSGQDNIEFVLEPKFDGLSVAIKYKNGVLVSAATRGDGHVGEDVTQNMMTVDIPRTIAELREVEIRGEVVMFKSDFQMLNKERMLKSEKLFANPRNAAAGSLRQLDADITKSRKLKFFPYAIIADDMNLPTQVSVINQLKDFGFLIPHKIILCNNQSQAYEFYKNLEKHRADLEYDIDGVVYKINDLSLQKKLGASTKFPRHSIAYKFTAEMAETTVLNIVVQVGRTGNITPVAELMPVTVGGVVISRATLHNKDEIEKKDIRIGDRVILQRAGDVIPQILYPIIEERKSNSQKFVFPNVCPCCGSILVQESDVVAIKCINLNCEAQLIEHLIHFVSKNAFDIDGLGEQNIKFFFELGIVRSPSDIFEIESKNSELHLEKMVGWGKQSVENLFAAINNAKQITLDRFIYSLGIPKVGRAVSRLIAMFFGSYSKFLACIETDTYEKLLTIDGVGELIVRDIRNFFSNQHNLAVIKKLAGDGVNNGLVFVQDIKQKENNHLSGYTFVFTGSLKNFSRNEAKDFVEKHGAKVSSSVSQRTSFVVLGENGGKKLDDARKLGVKIITEEEFQKIFEKNS